MSTAPNITQRVPPARRPRYFRLFLGLATICILALCYPPVFQPAVRVAARFEAWRQGIELSIGDVRGSLLEPLVLRDVTFTSRANGIAQIHLRIPLAHCSFSIKNLFLKRGAGWLHDLQIDGLDGQVVVLPANGVNSQDRPLIARLQQSSLFRWLIPERFDARRVRLDFAQNGDVVRFEQMSLVASESEPGTLRIRRIVVHEPWLQKTFTNVRGSVSVQDGAVAFTAMNLDRGVDLDSASADLAELAAGRLQMQFSLTAFGGAIRGEVKSALREPERLAFDATGSFSKISIAELAAFVGSTEEADGLIREGKFSFHGSPRAWEKATFTTRLEAGNFRLGKRQWNTLIAGATMSNGRIQIPELQLRQQHNSLTLNGDLAIPPPGATWWQSEFAFNIAARIDNLTELSALFDAQFANTAGKLTIDGSIRGANSSFNGQLIVSGSRLSYRNAPLDVLNAAIKLNGNELQVSHLEFSHGNDYLRGQGVVNILGAEKRYWGELRASIADLALYSDFLQPPIAPRSFAGGLFIDWSGDGTAHAHSGAFRARLNDVKPLGTADPAIVALDADLEGTYSPENIFFSKCVIGAGETQFSARVTADPKSVHLESLRLDHKKAAWLEGDALLPFNVWGAWQNPASPALWSFDTPVKVNLTANDLQLQTALLISGRKWPVKGEVQGTLQAEGTLAAPSVKGKLQISKVQFPSGEGQPFIVSEATATCDQQTVTLTRLNLTGPVGEMEATGQISLANLRDPILKLAVRGKGLAVAPASDLKLKTDAELSINGPASAPRVGGTLNVSSAELDRPLLFDALLHPLPPAGPPIELALTDPLLGSCVFDLHVTGQTAAKLNGTAGTARPDLHVTGPASNLSASGVIPFSGFTAASPVTPVSIEEGLLALPVSSPPALYVRGSSTISGYRITTHLLGTFPHMTADFQSVPPLEAESVRSLMEKGFAPGPASSAEFSLGTSSLPPADRSRPQLLLSLPSPSAAPPSDLGEQP